MQNIVASRKRTFVLHAQTDQASLSRATAAELARGAGGDKPEFATPNFKDWQRVSDRLGFHINEVAGGLQHGRRQERRGVHDGWRIPRANSVFVTPHGFSPVVRADVTKAGRRPMVGVEMWPEQSRRRLSSAYWMGRYYGFIKANE